MNLHEYVFASLIVVTKYMTRSSVREGELILAHDLGGLSPSMVGKAGQAAGPWATGHIVLAFRKQRVGRQWGQLIRCVLS